MINWHLPKVPGEGDAEFAAGIDVAEKHVCHRVASHRAGVPCFQQRSGHFVFAAQVERTAVQEHHGDPFAGCRKLFEQLCLHAGYADVGAGRGLSGPHAIFTDDENNLLCAAGRRQCGGESAAVFARLTAAFGIYHGCRFTYCVEYARGDGLHLARASP